MNHENEIRKERDNKKDEGRKYAVNLFEDPLQKKARKSSYDFKREMERVMLSQVVSNNNENVLSASNIYLEAGN